jgi:uncharacterized protein YqjF (DUF2071 family)
MKVDGSVPTTPGRPGLPDDLRVGPNPFEPVPRAHQLHRWSSLTFLHWPFAPDVVQALLPPGLLVDELDGRAWVGLVPFLLDVRIPGTPAIPWVTRFVETNVRTYVRTADGTRGIWFLSLDAQRLGAVALARTTWSLPYQWSRMRLTRTGDVVTYECRRRWPGAGHPSSRVVVEVGDTCRGDALDDLDHFLTARWVLFSTRGTALVRTQAHHDAWPLQRANVLELDDQLVRAAGLPAPTGAPRALYSDGVDVRLAGRRRVPR